MWYHCAFITIANISLSGLPYIALGQLFIEVLLIPRIISGPIQLEDQTLQCQFNASTLPEVTVVVWERNNIQLSNSSLYKIIQNSIPEDRVVSTLMINMSDYYGTYTCCCYYNNSLVTSTKTIKSNSGSLTLQES